MASRKWRGCRRRHYSTTGHDRRTRPTGFARSAAAETVDQVARDSQPFHLRGIPDHLGEAIAEAAARLPDVDDVLAGELVDDSR